MSGVATAIGGSAIIGAIASNSAANKEAGAANNATNLQAAEFNTQQANEAPYVQAGQQELGQLQTAMPDLTRNFTMADFQADPGYQFQLQQGQLAVANSAAARGLSGSSAAMKNMDSYTQGLANQDYEQARNNFVQNQTQRYNMMSNLASAGQTAIGQVNSAAQNYANQAGSNMMGAANAQAAGQIGMANALTGGVGMGINTWMQQQYLNKLNPSGGGGGGGDSGGIVGSGAGGGGYSVGGGDMNLVNQLD